MTKDRRRAMAAVATLVLLTGMLSTSASAASPDDADWLSGITISSAIAGPAVFKGTIRDAGGQRASGRATLVAWPANAELVRAADGDHIKTMPVGKADVGADGLVEVRVDPDAALEQYISPEGIVHFDLVVSGPEGGTVYSFSRRVANKAGVTTWLDPMEPAAAASAKTPATADLMLDPAMQGAAAEAADKFCVTTVLSTHNEREVIVGEVFTGPSAKAQVKYMVGSNSELGVGFSISGTGGSWSQSGTWTMSSTDEEKFPWQVQNTNRTMRTWYGYKNYKTECWDRGAYWKSFQFKPYENEGGQYLYSATAPSATYCTSYPAGGGRTRTSGTGYSFSTGVKVGTVIGIDLSAKTSYSTSTTTEYSFVIAGRLCGTNTYPGSSVRMVAKGP